MLLNLWDIPQKIIELPLVRIRIRFSCRRLMHWLCYLSKYLCLYISFNLICSLVCWACTFITCQKWQCICVFLNSIWALIWKNFMAGPCTMTTAVRLFQFCHRWWWSWSLGRPYLFSFFVLRKSVWCGI